MRSLMFGLLERLTDPALADSIAGDLEEEGHRRAIASPTTAAVWFWRELLAISVRAFVARARDLVTFERRFHLGPRWSNYRHGLRVCRRNPWYAATAIAVIALTLTLATTVFAVVEEVLFRQLPYERPEELYRVSAKFSDEALARTGGRVRNGDGGPLSMQDARDLSAAVPEARIVAYSAHNSQRALGRIGNWQTIAAPVGPEFLETLGVRPVIGGFALDDYELPAGATIPALVSHGVWQTDFGGRLDIVGQEYVPGDQQSTVRYRVAGVLPDDFVYPSNGATPDILTPLVVPASDRTDRRKRLYSFLVRLPPDRPSSEYQSRFNAVAQAAAKALPNSGVNGGAGEYDNAALTPLTQWLGVRQRGMSQQVLAVALLLVLLGCVNVSGLVATRSVDRARELALRRALGASARDVTALVFAECSVLVATGAVLGVALASPTLALVVRVMPAAIAPRDVPALDWRVLTFVAIVSAVSVAAVSCWPIFRSIRQASAPALADGGTPTTPTRTIGRFVAVSLQVAVGLILTLCGAFVVGSLLHGVHNDLGFTSERVVVLEGRIPDSAFAASGPNMPAGSRAPLQMRRQAAAVVLDEWLDRIRALPGVVAAGATHAPFLRAGGTPGGAFRGDTYAMTSGFVDALQPRLIAGRWPTAAEIAQGANVAVISPDAARQYFGEESPLGRKLAEGSSVVDVIGVAKPARYPSWDWNSWRLSQFYVPYRSPANVRPDPMSVVVVRTTNPQEVIAWALREARNPTSGVEPVSAVLADDLLDDTFRPRRFQSWLFGSFSAAALAIVGVGILGLAAMTSARRRREIGIRLTLGATRRGIIRQLLREQLVAVVVGIIAGGVAGFIAAAVLSGSYVYGVAPWDPLVWMAALGTILLTATIGILIPARRASRVDPVAALRCE